MTYCSLSKMYCPTTFSSDADCQTACAKYATIGTDGAMSGNTVQYRITHLKLIQMGMPAADHCQHTTPMPSSYCNM